MTNSEQYLILYYCLEINDLWELYGEGHDDPKIKTVESTKKVALGLLESQFYHEAFEILEIHLESSSTVFEALMQSQQDPSIRAACGLRLAEIQAKENEESAASETLASIHETIANQPFNHNIERRIQLRYINARTRTLSEVKDLSDIADWYLERGHFDDALKTIEDAAELHCRHPANSESLKLGMKLHLRLQDLCLSVEDKLSLTQFEFRKCDMIASLTKDLARARQERDKLLEQPICKRLPFFQAQHKRQWSEYSIVLQRDQALYHATKYLEFCQQYKSEADQSCADYCRLHSLTGVQRMSEEAKISMLQDAQVQIESSIEVDKWKGFDIPLIRKLLLLHDVQSSLDDSVGEYDEESQPTNASCLHEAEEIAARVVLSGEDATLQSQIFLRKYMTHKGQSRPAAPLASLNEVESNIDYQPLGLLNPQQMPRRSFRMYEYIGNLGIAIQSGEESVLSELIQRAEDEGLRLENEGGHSLEKAEFFTFKGFTYSALLDYSEVAKFDVLRLVRCSSPTICIEKCLKACDLALNFDDDHWKETQSSSEIVDMLASRQAFGTRSDGLLLLEIALKLSYRLGDMDEFWKWVQRSKSRSYSSLLREFSTKEQESITIAESHLDLEALIELSSTTNHKAKFVDWICFDSPAKILILVCSFEQTNTGVSKLLHVRECSISEPEIEKIKRRLNPAVLNSPDAQLFLKKLLPLVQPLMDLSEEGDLLVFCPTSLLHNVPLHAIELVGSSEILLERNPIVYTSSLEALMAVYSTSRGRRNGGQAERQQQKGVICSAYDEESEDPSIKLERSCLYTDLRQLADSLDGSSLLLGSELSAEAIKTKAALSCFLHFHGHAIYDEHDITKQMLVLGHSSGNLSLAEIAELDLERALVTLIACEGGLQDFSIGGDEPLGMLSCFFLGGATSVVAALWSIKSSTGRSFTKAFYRNLSRQKTTSQKHSMLRVAVALQATCVELKHIPGLENPYHWAAFVLHGLWFNEAFGFP